MEVINNDYTCLLALSFYYAITKSNTTLSNLFQNIIPAKIFNS